MNAMIFSGQHRSPTVTSTPSFLSSTGLERSVIAAGVADRRARAAAIEEEIDAACETAVKRVLPPGSFDDADAWSDGAWTAYLTEAVRQAKMHTPELETMRRDANHLERLLRLNPPS